MTPPFPVVRTNDSVHATISERGYQFEAVHKLWQALHEQDVPICLHLATGGGKTRIANDLIVKWLDYYGS